VLEWFAFEVNLFAPAMPMEVFLAATPSQVLQAAAERSSIAGMGCPCCHLGGGSPQETGEAMRGGSARFEIETMRRD